MIVLLADLGSSSSNARVVMCISFRAYNMSAQYVDPASRALLTLVCYGEKEYLQIQLAGQYLYITISSVHVVCALFSVK